MAYAGGLTSGAADWLQVHDVPSEPNANSSSVESELPTSQAGNSTGGLWARNDGRARKSWYYIATTICLVLSGYAVVMLVNAYASRILPRRYHVSEFSSQRLIWLVTHILDPLWLIGSTRALALAALLYYMSTLKGSAFVWPWNAEPEVQRAGLYAYASGMTNGLGYACYLALVKLDGVAIWSAMVGLYVVAPSLYFMFKKGESAGPRKLAGVLACAAAAVLLGMGKPESEPTAAGAAEATALWPKLALLFGVIGFWGMADGTQALAAQSGPAPMVAGCAGAGFGSVALACLILSWFISITAEDMLPAYGPSSACGQYMAALGSNSTSVSGQSAAGLTLSNLPCPPPLGTRLGALALVSMAQAGSMGAWYGVSILAGLSEASSFLPIVSLYTLLTSIGSVVFGGEALNAYGWTGLVLGGAGILAVGSS